MHSNEKRKFWIEFKMRYILDTYAWIEYFRGSAQGKKVKRIIENSRHTLITLESSVGELLLWCLKEDEEFKKLFTVVRNHSDIEPIYIDTWISAARIREEQRKNMKDFGLMDALILAKQKEIVGKIVTGDPHFKELKNVKFLF